MSIRNAMIARRRRTIGLSEQERMMLNMALRRRGDRSAQSNRQGDSLPLKRADKAASWHANWAEW